MVVLTDYTRRIGYLWYRCHECSVVITCIRLACATDIGSGKA